MAMKDLFEGNFAVRVERAFGPPVEHNGTLVIPVAFIAGGTGGGEQDGGKGAGAKSKSADASDPSWSGWGGGGGGLVWPIGVYTVRGDRVRWIPALDATRILVALLSVVKLMVKLKNRRSE
jgi:uncharacterized spore protein YtfJ